MPFTTSVAQAILAEKFSERNYIGLSTSTPTDTGGNFSEPSTSTGYNRAPIGTLDKSIDRQIANAEYIFMFECLASCGTFTHFGIFTSGTPGNGAPIFYGELDNVGGLSVTAGYVPLIRPHELIVGLDVNSLNTNY